MGPTTSGIWNACAPGMSAAFAPGPAGSGCQDGFGPDGVRSSLDGVVGPDAGDFLRVALTVLAKIAATLSADVRQAAQFPDLPPRRGRCIAR
jgi:hypothetical protein